MKSMAGELKLAQDINAKVVFATKLMNSAASVHETPTDRYGYYSEAIDVYSNIGDLMSAFRAIDTIKDAPILPFSQSISCHSQSLLISTIQAFRC
ncbi:MAG: hypothetical protein JWP89_5170 [Schlesneria sp.]|nr:hypothetical protein [Schlesneria sp.]